MTGQEARDDEREALKCRVCGHTDPNPDCRICRFMSDPDWRVSY